MSHVQIPPPDVPRTLPTLLVQQMDRQKVLDVPNLNREKDWEVEAAQAENHAPGQTGAMSETPVNARSSVQASNARSSSAHVLSPNALSETIEAQFNLEILLKHKELLLIDQEFAKCQVALEQLRRCHVIPYPAMSDMYEDLQAATAGSGTAFDNRAPHAPPWGVTDGPYTQHYQRWLLTDSAFDDKVPEVQIPRPCAGKTLPDRATRGSKAPDLSILATNPRSQRGSTSARLKALPHGYPEPKEEKGPMIVKRSSDGKIVKLVCLDCRRSDFNSTQGFINHCRIAHSRQFLSHDAAIEASGEEVDENAQRGLGEVNGTPATASAGLVHPLVRSALVLRNSNVTPTEHPTSSRRKKSQVSTTPMIQTPTESEWPSAMATPQRIALAAQNSVAHDPVPFRPSPRTPHLSAFLERMNCGGDLEEMVTEAKTIPEPDPSISSDEEDDEEMEESSSEAPQSRSTRGIIRGGLLPAQTIRDFAEEPSTNPTSSKPSLSNATHAPGITQPRPQDLYPTPSSTIHESLDEQIHSLHQNHDNLSPKTAESHGPPSLMDDEGESEHPDESEAESASSAEEDDESKHFRHPELVDHDQMVLGEGGSSDAAAAAHWYHEKPHAPHHAEGGRRHHNERHVSFETTPPAPVKKRRREERE